MPADEAVIYQHYRVLRRDDGSLWKLGAGAMGVTYKAIDTNLDATVALKVINSTYTNNEAARERFIREAKAAASLRHHNVASVYHLGNDAQSFFYAMEFIDGETVEHFVGREGPQSWRIALPAMLQAARALMAAHEKKLVHRDIKPANIMLVRELGEDDLSVKLIDFGLAKSLAEVGGSVVNVSGSGFLGTPLFASPEQCEEIAPDIRSDIYSLGVTLWFVLTGRAPFGGGLAKVLAQHVHAPLPWNQLPAAAPEPLRTLLTRMLAKDREDRPQEPDELRREIELCLRACGRSISGGPGNPVPPPAPAPAPSDTAGLATQAEVTGTVPFPEESSRAARVETPRVDFTLKDCLRRENGCLPPAVVANLLGPLAQIVDAAGQTALHLSPGGIRIISPPEGGAPASHHTPFMDPSLTGGHPGRLEVRPLAEAGGKTGVLPASGTIPPEPRRFDSPVAALAALTYELLGGTPPPPHRTSPPLTACSEAQNAILRLASKEATNPYSDAVAFAQAFVQAGPPGRRSIRSNAAAIPGTGTGDLRRRLHPGVWIGLLVGSAAIAGVLVLAVGGFHAWRNHSTAITGSPALSLGGGPSIPVPAPIPPQILIPRTLLVPAKFPTVQTAIDAANPGDTVSVAAGEYPEALKFKDGITLTGAGKDKTIVRAPVRPGSLYALEVHSCRAGAISDFGFEKAGGISLETSAVQLHRCRVFGSEHVEGGIVCTAGDQSDIEDCEVVGSGRNGIYVETGSKSTLIHNRCEKNELAGISVRGAGTTATLTENQARGNSTGIDFRDGAGGTAEGNFANNNTGDGIAVRDAGTAPTLTNNQMRANETGLDIRDGAGARVERNSVSDNTSDGIVVRGAGTAELALSGNAATGNQGDGIMFRDGAGGVAKANLCENNKGAGIEIYGVGTAPIIADNRGTKNGDCGILVGDDTKPVILSGNTVTGLTHGGVYRPR